MRSSSAHEKYLRCAVLFCSTPLSNHLLFPAVAIFQAKELFVRDTHYIVRPGEAATGGEADAKPPRDEVNDHVSSPLSDRFTFSIQPQRRAFFLCVL